MFEIRNLSKTFYYRTCLFFRKNIEVLKPLSFILKKRKTLAIVGKSGSGKSILANILAGLIKPSYGELLIDNQPLIFGDHSFRNKHIRMIFRNPLTSLNLHQRIFQILDFPLRMNTDLCLKDRYARIVKTLRLVGLLPDHVNYYPYMLSESQKQYLGVARAIILHPKVIIADEIFTSLDIILCSQMINLMLDLQEKQNIAYIYLTQYLDIVNHISDQILIIHKGEIIERGDTIDVLASPIHSLTRQLIDNSFIKNYAESSVDRNR